MIELIIIIVLIINVLNFIGRIIYKKKKLPIKKIKPIKLLHGDNFFVRYDNKNWYAYLKNNGAKFLIRDKNIIKSNQYFYENGKYFYEKNKKYYFTIYNVNNCSKTTKNCDYIGVDQSGDKMFFTNIDYVHNLKTKLLYYKLIILINLK